jgi:hypothetical protein
LPFPRLLGEVRLDLQRKSNLLAFFQVPLFFMAVPNGWNCLF